MMYNNMEEKAGIIRSTSRPSSCSALGMMNKNSQIISKLKPQIRIVHVFAPEIIKTDVANFRELVQSLTGKPSLSDKKKKKKKKKETNIYNMKQSKNNTNLLEERSTMLNCVTTFQCKKMELRTGFINPSEWRERIKGEEEIWRNANSGGGFMDGLMEEFNQFPLLPSDAAHMDAYGESQLA